MRNFLRSLFTGTYVVTMPSGVRVEADVLKSNGCIYVVRVLGDKKIRFLGGNI